jgi:hypothetical protein
MRSFLLRYFETNVLQFCVITVHSDANVVCCALKQFVVLAVIFTAGTHASGYVCSAALFVQLLKVSHMG